MEEIWKDVEGWEGQYQVSNLGRIKSFPKTWWTGRHYITTPERIIRGQGEYLKVKCGYIHQLVAKHFIPNPENKPTVNHKDGNKHNNCVNNLEWATYSENIKHAYNTGLNPSTKGIPAWNSNRWRPVYKMDLNENILYKFNSLQEAADDINVPYKYIYKVCKGEISNTRGFKYKYVQKG